MTDAAGPGHNNPPPEGDFLSRLEAANEDLVDLEADLELDLGRLPREVGSDDDVAKINAWVTRARKLARDTEAKREVAKAPYLERERQIDGWFGRLRDGLKRRATEIEKRSAPYLLAKQRREEEEAAERARIAREEADRRAAAERQAREEQEAAQRARAEEERRLREETQQREREAAQAKERTTREQREATERQQREAAAAEQRLRDAAKEEAAATARLEAAQKETRKGDVAADRAEAKAERGTVAKTQGGGASTQVKMVGRFRITSWPALMQSMGPINTYLDAKWLEQPLARWASIPNRSEIPGVEWFEEPEVKTTATRT